jgi:hypothetical protein
MLLGGIKNEGKGSGYGADEGSDHLRVTDAKQDERGARGRERRGGRTTKCEGGCGGGIHKAERREGQPGVEARS